MVYAQLGQHPHVRTAETSPGAGTETRDSLLFEGAAF